MAPRAMPAGSAWIMSGAALGIAFKASRRYRGSELNCC